MALKRIFLGWDEPVLQTALDWLTSRFTCDEGLDLSQVIIATPGRRAGRRLLEKLAQRAAGLSLSPPRLCTPTDLAAELYQPTMPTAPAFTSMLLRINVLRETPAEQLADLLPEASQPAAGDLVGWYNIARQLTQLHRALASEMRRFEDVAQIGGELPHFHQQDRWDLLAELQTRYEHALAAHELVDHEAAYLSAAGAGDVACERHVVLLAATDLNRQLRTMLAAAADSGDVTALVPAPESHGEGFDELGCIERDYWEAQAVKLDRQWLSFVDRPRDQASHTLQLLHQMSEIDRRLTGAGDREGSVTPPADDGPCEAIDPLPLGWSPDQVTLGLCDPAEAPLMERTLDSAGLPSRTAAGVPLSRSRPATLLAALSAYLRHQRMDDFAALVRHPDLHAYLEAQLKLAPRDLDASPQTATPTSPAASHHQQQDRWLVALDHYRSEHLCPRFGDGNPADDGTMAALHQAIVKLLPDDATTRRRLAEWAQPVADMLAQVYGDRRLHRMNPQDAPLISALQSIRTSLSEQQQAEVIGDAQPRVTLTEALALLLAQCADQAVPPEPGAAAVELLGWLELPLDDAPVLVVTSLNEGLVPSSQTADPFLPDQLRAALDMPTQRDRYARDLLLLNVILHSRPHVALIAARHDAQGDPRPPSRLLLACDDATRAQRIDHYYGRAGLVQCIAHGVQAYSYTSPQSTNAFLMAWPDANCTIPDRLHVTAFRDYLACPYRFYLRHIAQLRSVDDRSRELTLAQFGNLAHDVLNNFGHSDEINSARAPAIYGYLSDQLDRLAAERFGKSPLVAVVLQIEQLRMRLHAFAQLQAGLRANGWRSLKHESKVVGKLDVDGSPLTLSGKIDRIDRHEETGQWLVIDYKTSDSAKTPDAAHRKGPKDNKQWCDLQLPLYRVLLQTCEGSQIADCDDVMLAYIALPKKLEDVKLLEAKWSPQELAEAHDLACEVVRKIRQRIFWEPQAPPRFDDDLGSLCLDKVLQRQDIIKATYAAFAESTDAGGIAKSGGGAESGSVANSGGVAKSGGGV